MLCLEWILWLVVGGRRKRKRKGEEGDGEVVEIGVAEIPFELSYSCFLTPSAPSLHGLPHAACGSLQPVKGSSSLYLIVMSSPCAHLMCLLEEGCFDVRIVFPKGVLGDDSHTFVKPPCT